MKFVSQRPFFLKIISATYVERYRGGYPNSCGRMLSHQILKLLKNISIFSKNQRIVHFVKSSFKRFAILFIKFKNLQYKTRMGGSIASFQSKKENINSTKTPEQNLEEQTEVAIDFINEKYIANSEFYDVKQEEMGQLMHRCIGVLLGKDPVTKQHMKGSGFLISKNLVLTSAHNIADGNGTKCKFYPGALGVLSNPIDIAEVRYPTEFKSSSVKLDYALLKLANDVPGEQFLSLGVGFMNQNEKLSIFGYPGDYYKALDKYCETFSVIQMGCSKEHCGKIAENYRLDYSISTLPGQSGCPVILQRGQQSIAIAIHKAGVPNQDMNTSRLIDVRLLMTLEKWRQQMKGSPFQIKYVEQEKPIRVKDIDELMENYLFFFDKFSKNASSFLLRANIAQKISKNSEMVQISSRMPIFTSDNKKIKFKIEKFGHKKSIIIIGICTKRLIDNHSISGEEPESLGFSVFQRYLQEFRFQNVNTLNKITKAYSDNQFEVTIHLNIKNWTIGFLPPRESVEKVFPLPSSFKGKQLYYYVSMTNKGDRVQVFE